MILFLEFALRVEKPEVCSLHVLAGKGESLMLFLTFKCVGKSLVFAVFDRENDLFIG